jgi:hypothetical protein
LYASVEILLNQALSLLPEWNGLQLLLTSFPLLSPSLYPPTLSVSALFGNACEYEILGVLAMVLDGSWQFFDLDYRTFLFLSLVCVRLFGETTNYVLEDVPELAASAIANAIL